MNNKPTSRFLLTLLGRDDAGRKDFIDKGLEWNENLKVDSGRREMLRDALHIMLAPKPDDRNPKIICDGVQKLYSTLPGYTDGSM